LSKRTIIITVVAVAIAVPPLVVIAGRDRDVGSEVSTTTSSASDQTGPRGDSPPVPNAEVEASSTRTLVPVSKALPIAFAGLEDGRYQLFSTDAEGRRTVRISDRRTLFPAWSPDGRRLAIVTEAQGFTTVRLGIAVLGPEREIREALHGPQVPSHPSFDRATRSIVYQSTLETQSGAAGARGLSTIDSVPTAGGNQRTIIDEDGAAFQPAVSPRSGEIAAIIGDAGCSGKRCEQQLVLYDADARDPQTLTNEGAAAAPAWSPDATRIAFTWDRGDGHAIWVLEVDSGQLVQVTSGAESDSEPTWSPDGSALAFSRACDIFVQRVEGGQARNLTQTKRCEISPTWRPS
jgi:Tol biopolymer transport system component